MAVPTVPFLTNSTSTSATSGDILSPGEWKFSLDTANAAASVTIDAKPIDGTNFMPVTKGGVAVALTTIAPFVIETSIGETYRVTNASGASAATVRADKSAQNIAQTYQ